MSTSNLGVILPFAFHRLAIFLFMCSTPLVLILFLSLHVPSSCSQQELQEFYQVLATDLG